MYKYKGSSRKLSASKKPKSSNRVGAGGRRKKSTGRKHDSRFEDRKPKGKRRPGMTKHTGRFDNGKPRGKRRSGESKRGAWVDERMPAEGSKSKSSNRSSKSEGRIENRTSSSTSRFSKSGGRRRAYRSDGGRSEGRKHYGTPKRGSQSRGGRSSSRSGGYGRGNKTIDIVRIIHQASNAPKPKEHITKHTFADFNFIPELQNNLETIEFVTPTPIQDLSIPHVMDGKDVVGVANTGTGKTGVFLLPLIDRIARDRTHKALIITPTRELASQIDGEFRKFSKGMRILSSECIGGVPLYRQLDILKRNPSIVIGTPGRLKDLRDRGALRFDSFNTIVLDEVDRMLDMGFIDIIRNILDQVSENRQSLFFSATIPPVINKLIQKFLQNPVTIEISSGQAAYNVKQDVIRVADHKMKFEALKEVLAKPDFEKVLIFSETKRDVEKLTKNLYQIGFKVDSIHGDKRQSQRKKSLTRFRENRINILVATDVAARGLDIKDVSHVINYTIPQSYDDYIHRIGRTGRGTSKGMALTFI